MIDIRDKNAAIRASVEITDQCIYSKKLMEEEYVLLSFESDTLIKFAKGDYIQTENGTFYIVYLDRPHQSANGGYTYEQKLHAGWERWRNHITFYNRQKGSEKSWKMTQRPEYFLDIICSNIKSAGYGDYTFEIDSRLTEMKLVEFDSTNIIDALTKVAEAWGTEWWISDNIIHLSKCEFGTPLPLSENDELGIVDREDGSDTNYFTRAYVFGSTRNLPKNYRKNDDSSVVIEGVVETRLKLPAGVPYIDAWENMKDEDVVEGVIILDEVYPRKTGVISTVTTKKYTDEIENEDGSKTQHEWNAFRFTDSDLAALKFSSEYILPGEELRIIFQTGKLAGMEFGVIFNPDGLDESKSDAQLFEIVRNDDYGVELPTDDFKPAVGDTYILYGYDTQFVYTKLVGEAEKELHEKGIEKVAEASCDKSVYNCPTNPVRCAGYKENSKGELIHSSLDEIDLDVGQSVALKSPNHFPNGPRASRIRGFEKKLRNRYEATYIVGESSAYSHSEALEEQVKQLTYQSKQFININGSSIYVIGRYDKTAPSDFNTFSAQRSLAEFLSKTKDDSAAGLITFLKGLVSRELSRFKGGAEFGEFVSGMMTGFGGAIDSKGNAEFESLIVRSTMQVMELIINRIGAQEGDTLFSESDTIETLTDNGDGTWLLKLKSKYDGYFTAMTAGMVIKGVINDLASGGTDYYTSWMRVNSVNASANTIEVSIYPDSEVPAGRNFPPCELMKLVRWGHQTDTKKQSIFYISSTEGRIVKLTRVDRPIIDFSNYEVALGTLPEKLFELLPIPPGESGLYVKHLIAETIWQCDHQGRPLPTIRDRGPHDPAEKYYSGDTMRPETNDWEQSDAWHLGCRWRCMVTGTARAPAWNVTDWAFIEGNPEFRVELLGAPTAIRPRNFKFTLRVKATLYNADVTADILDSDIEWTRYTEDSDGNQRVSSDNAWAMKRAAAAKEITLTQDDLDITGGVVPPVARFIVSVRLRDGKDPVSAVFGYRV